MCWFPTASDLNSAHSHHNLPNPPCPIDTPPPDCVVATLYATRSDTLKDVPEFFEVELGESLLSRTETLGKPDRSVRSRSPLEEVDTEASRWALRLWPPRAIKRNYGGLTGRGRRAVLSIPRTVPSSARTQR